mmetsp:Transcript_4904/g.10829  ORF Transcript_4904/g.10829 Transcript_4904/m.10829 type:complete len:239 (+) Transcript_4904:2173-2889(+)
MVNHWWIHTRWIVFFATVVMWLGRVLMHCINHERRTTLILLLILLLLLLGRLRRRWHWLLHMLWRRHWMRHERRRKARLNNHDRNRLHLPCSMLVFLPLLLLLPFFGSIHLNSFSLVLIPFLWRQLLPCLTDNSSSRPPFILYSTPNARTIVVFSTPLSLSDVIRVEQVVSRLLSPFTPSPLPRTIGCNFCFVTNLIRFGQCLILGLFCLSQLLPRLARRGYIHLWDDSCQLHVGTIL